MCDERERETVSRAVGPSSLLACVIDACACVCVCVCDVDDDDATFPDVVRIAYAEQYVDTMNYFRAVYATGETSERVLRLTKEAIEMNGANYTVWHHRWQLVLALGADLAAELAYVEAMALENPKNYQVGGGGEGGGKGPRRKLTNSFYP